MDRLKKILDYKKLETEHRSRRISLSDMQKRSVDQEPARDFFMNWTDDQLNIIAEIKKASPSAGIIREDFNPVDIAHIYQDFGAQSISVLTDENFFQGHNDYLVQVRNSVSLPLLRKDFTVSEFNIFEGRALGADAILLIVAALDQHQLHDYLDLTKELGMTALVEVHDHAELERALEEKVFVTGINNRNLKTFETNIQTTFDLLARYKLDKNRVISESGLKDHKTLVALKNVGVNGFLVGESLMRQSDIGKALRCLREG